jgi:hypothetical protein
MLPLPSTNQDLEVPPDSSCEGSEMTMRSPISKGRRNAIKSIPF